MVPAGTFVQASGGDTFAPPQSVGAVAPRLVTRWPAYFAAINPPSVKALEVTLSTAACAPPANIIDSASAVSILCMADTRLEFEALMQRRDFNPPGPGTELGGECLHHRLLAMDDEGGL